MKAIYLTVLLTVTILPTASDARTFYENNASTINTLIGCLATKSSAIFTIPRQTYHALVIDSAHWSVTRFAQIKNAHLVRDVKFETHEIEVGDQTGEALDIKKIVMSTEFQTIACIGESFRILEKTKRLEKDC